MQCASPSGLLPTQQFLLTQKQFQRRLWNVGASQWLQCETVALCDGLSVDNSLFGHMWQILFHKHYLTQLFIWRPVQSGSLSLIESLYGIAVLAAWPKVSRLNTQKSLALSGDHSRHHSSLYKNSDGINWSLSPRWSSSLSARFATVFPLSATMFASRASMFGIQTFAEKYLAMLSLLCVECLKSRHTRLMSYAMCKQVENDARWKKKFAFFAQTGDFERGKKIDAGKFLYGIHWIPFGYHGKVAWQAMKHHSLWKHFR